MGTISSVGDENGGAGGHFQCPFCNTYEVARLYLASLDIDSCECATCGARWDEDRRSGSYRGRADRASVLMPRQR